MRTAVILAALAGVLILGACSRPGESTAQATQNQPGSAGGSAVPAESNAAPASLDRTALPRIPVGTAISVRMLSTISSSSAHAGEEYEAELAAPIEADGQILFNRSARARVQVVSAVASGGLKQPGFLRITLASVQDAHGNWVPIATAPLSAKAKSHKTRNAAIIGGVSALGAAIGGIAGGGKGAAIGAISGAGAGTAGAYATGKRDVAYWAETVLKFRATGTPS